MSNRTLDRILYNEHVRDEIACCECGYYRNGEHHPGVKCPKTGRCGECGNNWPCPDHAQMTPVRLTRAQKRVLRDLVIARGGGFTPVHVHAKIRARLIELGFARETDGFLEITDDGLRWTQS